jgi:hypothetical protein
MVSIEKLVAEARDPHLFHDLGCEFRSGGVCGCGLRLARARELLNVLADVTEAAMEWEFLHRKALAGREQAEEMWSSGLIPKAHEKLRAALDRLEKK